MRIGWVLFLICGVLVAGDREEKAVKAGKGLMKSLGSVLKMKIQEEGPVAAIEFCSEKAITITTDESKKWGMTLSRITDKPRNSDNKANEEEMALITTAKSDLAKGELKKVYKIDQAVYMPMLMKPLCLTCHGEQIPPQILKEIENKYPRDKAEGYKEGELRGFIKIVE